MPRNLVAKLTRSTNQIGKVALNGVSDAATPEEIRNYAMLFGKLFPDRVKWEAPEQTASTITISNEESPTLGVSSEPKLASKSLENRSPKPLFEPLSKQTVKLPKTKTMVFNYLKFVLNNPGTTVTEIVREYCSGYQSLDEARRNIGATMFSYSHLFDRIHKPSKLKFGSLVWCYSLKPEVAEAMREALKV